MSLHFFNEENAILLNGYSCSVFIIENNENLFQLSASANTALLKTMRYTSDEVLKRIDKMDPNSWARTVFYLELRRLKYLYISQ